jgi:hypothetical protein
MEGIQNNNNNNLDRDPNDEEICDESMPLVRRDTEHACRAGPAGVDMEEESKDQPPCCEPRASFSAHSNNSRSSYMSASVSYD